MFFLTQKQVNSRKVFCKPQTILTAKMLTILKCLDVFTFATFDYDSPFTFLPDFKDTKTSIRVLFYKSGPQQIQTSDFQILKYLSKSLKSNITFISLYENDLLSKIDLVIGSRQILLAPFTQQFNPVTSPIYEFDSMISILNQAVFEKEFNNRLMQCFSAEVWLGLLLQAIVSCLLISLYFRIFKIRIKPICLVSYSLFWNNL